MHDYARIADELLAERNKMRPLWDWLAKHIMPRKSDILAELKDIAGKSTHNSTASESLHLLVGSVLSDITPMGGQWMEYASPSGKSEGHKLWYRNASEVTLRQLAMSNFYSAIHEHDIDWALFGTAALFCEDLNDGELRFTNAHVGSFSFADDKNGRPDTWVHEFSYTAHQMVQEWGSKAMPEEVMRAYNDPRDRFTKTFTIHHLILPRKGYTLPNGKRNTPGKKMPFASVYFMAEGQRTILAEGGFAEFPVLISRFLKWDDKWGYPPALKVRTEIMREMKLERDLDLLADMQVFPRFFVDAEQDGDIDFRPGGQTVIAREAAGLNLPREWGTQGRYDIGMDRLNRTTEKVEKAFYAPFLRVVSGQDRAMTATEVVARQREQIIAITSAFSRYVADLKTLQARIFAVLFRAGKFETPKGTMPQDLLVYTAAGDNYAIMPPEVEYRGRIMQAIKAAQKQSLDYSIESASNYIQMTGDTSALDRIDVARVVEFIFQSTGAPSEIFRSDAEVQKIRQQREDAAAAQQQLALAEINAKNAQAQKQ